MKPTELLMFVGLLFYFWAIGYLGGWPSTLRKIQNNEITDCEDPLLKDVYKKEDSESSLYVNIRDMFFANIEIPCRSADVTNVDTQSTTIVQRQTPPDKPAWFCNDIRRPVISEYDWTCESYICEVDNNGLLNRSIYSNRNSEYQDFLQPGAYELSNFPDCINFIFNLNSETLANRQITIKCKRDYLNDDLNPNDGFNCTNGCSLNSPWYHLCVNTHDENNQLLFANSIPTNSFLSDVFYIIPVERVRALSSTNQEKYEDYVFMYNLSVKRFVRFYHDFTKPRSFIRDGSYTREYLYCNVSIHDIEQFIAKDNYKELQECMFKITNGLDFENSTNYLTLNQTITIYKIQPYTEFENKKNCQNDPKGQDGPEYFEYVVQEPAAGLITTYPPYFHSSRQHATGYNWFECYIERFKYDWFTYKDEANNYWKDQYLPFRSDDYGTKGKFIISTAGSESLQDRCSHGIWTNLTADKNCFVDQIDTVQNLSTSSNLPQEYQEWKSQCGKNYTIGRDPNPISQFCTDRIEYPCVVELENQNGDKQTYSKSFPSNADQNEDLLPYVLEIDDNFQDPKSIRLTGHKNRLCAAYFFEGTNDGFYGPKVYTKYVDDESTSSDTLHTVTWNIGTEQVYLKKYQKLLIIEENPKFGYRRNDNNGIEIDQAAYMCRAWMGSSTNTKNAMDNLLNNTRIQEGEECKVQIKADGVAYEAGLDADTNLNQRFCGKTEPWEIHHGHTSDNTVEERSDMSDKVNAVSMLGFPSNVCMLNLCEHHHSQHGTSINQGCHSYSEDDCTENDIKVSLPENRTIDDKQIQTYIHGYALYTHNEYVEEDDGIWFRYKANKKNNERTRCKNRELNKKRREENDTAHDTEVTEWTDEVNDFKENDISAFRLERKQITYEIRRNNLSENKISKTDIDGDLYSSLYIPTESHYS